MEVIIIHGLAVITIGICEIINVVSKMSAITVVDNRGFS
jgi:hypothetical protein